MNQNILIDHTKDNFTSFVSYYDNISSLVRKRINSEWYSIFLKTGGFPPTRIIFNDLIVGSMISCLLLYSIGVISLKALLSIIPSTFLYFSYIVNNTPQETINEDVYILFNSLLLYVFVYHIYDKIQTKLSHLYTRAIYYIKHNARAQ